MAVNETIVTGRKFRKLIDEATKLWQRISFWTKSSDGELDDGENAENKVGAIKGITTDPNVTVSGYATDMKFVSQLNSNMPFFNTQNLIKKIQIKSTGGKTVSESWTTTENCFIVIESNAYTQGQCNLVVNNAGFCILHNDLHYIIHSSAILPLKEGTSVGLVTFAGNEDPNGYANIYAWFYSL